MLGGIEQAQATAVVLQRLTQGNEALKARLVCFLGRGGCGKGGRTNNTMGVGLLFSLHISREIRSSLHPRMVLRLLYVVPNDHRPT
jgi:hypothetical protein